MPIELPKAYEFKEIEAKEYERWLKEGLFHARTDSPSPVFSMVIPPPNITGVLHMGHALNSTLQDILSRWHKMKGFNVLWVPGTDHAGIATQNVVEKQLAKEKKRKEDLGREDFIRKTWEWKEASGGAIIQQLKRLGASCDWERERFTMDAGLSRAVEEVFLRLYQEGLIYRSERLINWCVRCHTALSDIEVIHEDIEGAFYHIYYPLEGNPGKKLEVATTRPETLLGDTAVAVHPDDSRYSGLIGKKVLIPLTGIQIPIIGDPAVDREFGTGAVKVTPGHDFNDYEMGLRHHLPVENILTPDGKLVRSPRTAEFAGLNIPSARKAVVARLQEEGFLAETKKHLHAVGKCYRCGTVVEPYLSNQWFVKIAPLAAPAIEAVREGKTEFVPKNWENTYFAWMENIKDWCVSRQLWWGHRIPAWYCLSCNPPLRENPVPFLFKEITPVVSARKPASCAVCGKSDFLQDPDVLDTWFSSALWPFSTLGWPDQTPELRKFYPTSVLVTGFDIVFFWVARMMMMGLKFMGDVPFRQVYIHALVRDAEGQKMSKSKGNVVDPLELMDRYGTDAFRFTLASMASPGRDILLDEERFAGYRNFCNKLWNATRFILLNLEDAKPEYHENPAPVSLPDRWILLKLDQCIRETNSSLEQFRFDEAAHQVYHFIWHEFCDWYLEFSKPLLQEPDQSATRRVMLHVLHQVLRLLHPFMPFITEAIWNTVFNGSSSILEASYPRSSDLQDLHETGKKTENLKEVIRGLRNIRGENNIPPSREITVFFLLKEKAAAGQMKELAPLIKKLGKLVRFEYGPDVRKPAFGASAAVEMGTLYVDLTGITDPKDEIRRLEKQSEKVMADLAAINRKFENPNFAKNAPEKVVREEESRKKQLEEKHAFLQKEINHLKTLS